MSQSNVPAAPAARRPTLYVAASSAHAYWIVALAIVVLGLLYHRMPGSLGYPLDDGYISLHSAQVLHWGQDPNFPNTPSLVGITNSPFVLMLWALLFGMSPLPALQLASWLGVLCYALGLVSLGRAFRLPLPAVLALSGLGLTVAKVPYQLLNGVETGMAMGVVLWILALATANTAWSRRVAAALCGFAPFLRPELIALCVLVLLAILVRDWGHDRINRDVVFSNMALWGIAVLSAIPWLIWYGSTTGSIIPQTIEAKRLFFADGCAPSAYRWTVLVSSSRLFAAVLGVMPFSLVFLSRSVLGRFTAFFIPLFFLVYYERLPGALFHNQGRYTYLLVPLLLFGLASGMGDKRRWSRIAAYGLLIVACLQTEQRFPFHWHQFLEHRDRATQSQTLVAQWSVDHLPASATLLIHDAGYLSYATRFHLVDFVGLKTPSSVDFNRRFTYGRCGAGPALAVSEIARQTKADFLIMIDEWDSVFHVTPGLRMFGWKVEEINRSGDYHVFRLTPPQEPIAEKTTVR
jgi:hypothetical protein